MSMRVEGERWWPFGAYLVFATIGVLGMGRIHQLLKRGDREDEPLSPFFAKFFGLGRS
jgi:hypothetical protein